MQSATSLHKTERASGQILWDKQDNISSYEVNLGCFPFNQQILELSNNKTPLENAQGFQMQTIPPNNSEIREGGKSSWTEIHG